MKALAKRLDALEEPQRVMLSPSARRWLGLPLTEAVGLEADKEEGKPFDRCEVENSNISQEAKAWLLQD